MGSGWAMGSLLGSGLSDLLNSIVGEARDHSISLGYARWMDSLTPTHMAIRCCEGKSRSVI